jgi:hypothetical protein
MHSDPSDPGDSRQRTGTNESEPTLAVSKIPRNRLGLLRFCKLLIAVSFDGEQVRGNRPLEVFSIAFDPIRRVTLGDPGSYCMPRAEITSFERLVVTFR